MAALSAATILSADNGKADPGIEARLTRLDLSVTLKQYQYENVKRLKADAELQAELLKGSAEKTSEPEAVALVKRIAILHDHAELLRHLALRYDAGIQ